MHVGQEDAPYAEARALLGPDKIVGVTCHDSRHLAMEAAEAGADYVAFGAFYPTGDEGREDARRARAPDLVAGDHEIPCVAIGGITVENGAPLVDAGADFLAVSAACGIILKGRKRRSPRSTSCSIPSRNRLVWRIEARKGGLLGSRAIRGGQPPLVFSILSTRVIMKIAGNEIKPGAVIEHDGSLWVAVKTQAVKPGKGGAYNQVELKNLFNGRKLNERFRSAETVEEVELDFKTYSSCSKPATC